MRTIFEGQGCGYKAGRNGTMARSEAQGLRGVTRSSLPQACAETSGIPYFRSLSSMATRVG